MKTYIHANSQIITQHTGDHEADRYFYLHDRLGSVRQIIDTSGNVKNRYTYDPFGEAYSSEVEEDQNLDNVFKFTGQYFDSEIDQYYLRARQYDPHINRFTSRDPVFGDLEEPLTLHVYLYCINDPVNKIDPRGLENQNYDLSQTQMILDAVTLLVGTNYAAGPMLAFHGTSWSWFGKCAPFDFSYNNFWRNDTFRVASHGHTLSTGQFGNYAAGYSTYYNYGMRGEAGARAAGIAFAIQDRKFSSRPFAEEVGSQYWITEGALAANIARSKSVRFSLMNLTSHDSTFGNLLDRHRLELWSGIFWATTYFQDFHLYTD